MESNKIMNSPNIEFIGNKSICAVCFEEEERRTVRVGLREPAGAETEMEICERCVIRMIDTFAFAPVNPKSLKDDV